jgi:hypothetical protein
VSYRGDVRETYVLEDSARLLAALGLTAEIGLAMYPRLSFELASPAAAEEAAEVLGTVLVGDGPMFHDLHLQGTTVSMVIEFPRGATELATDVRFTPTGAATAQPGDLADLGIVIRSRPGGGNTAYHVPEGIFVAYGAGIAPDASRRRVSVLDAAPSLLQLLDVEPAATMQGEPSIFAGDDQRR